ncbi:hypothetical protein IFR04_001836 [Cadophora malorum]|uniref:Uncharacterized protein n=1 Tax=Cadophora malorum TaxID=108018 RepID=A0A8H7WHK8_9HELO|nr:hypothetical protein IFR04_001836 [Cadophora malorum]
MASGLTLVDLVIWVSSCHLVQGFSEGCYPHQANQASRDFCSLLKLVDFATDQRTSKAVHRPPPHLEQQIDLADEVDISVIERVESPSHLDDARFLVPDKGGAGLLHPAGNGNLKPNRQVDLLLPGPQDCASLKKHQTDTLRARNFTRSTMAPAFSQMPVLRNLEFRDKAGHRR